jgi:predicted flap endonuclease-1-like 5' DNA nuclease
MVRADPDVTQYTRSKPMSDQQQAPETLAVFVLDNGAAARRLLEAVEKVDEVNDNVQIVDAAIAERTKRRGAVKVHQTRDRGALKGGVRGTAIGVVVGTIIAGPAGAVVAGAAGGLLNSLRNRFHDIGVDDKFMKQVASEIEKGKSALFVQYTGNWSASIGLIEQAIQAENALLITSTLPAETAAALRALVEPAAESLGGEEVVADFEIEVEEAPEEAAEEAAPAAAVAAGADNGRGDDLTQLVGIGPKAASALSAAGIGTYAALSEANEPQIRRALHDSDMTPPSNVSTWPMQASYATKGDWQGLMKHNEKARGSAKPAAPRTETAAAAPPDDLTQIKGIGPRIATILNDGGITTYAELQRANSGDLRQIIAVGGALPPSSLESWPTQASYAVRGDWSGLATYNR